MNISNKNAFLKSWVIGFLFFSFLGLGFSFPSFDFSESSYQPGPVNVNFKSSQGIAVSMFSNDNFVKKVDVVSEPLVISISGEISNVAVPIYSKVIFKNDDLSKTFRINISGILFQQLAPGQSSNEIFASTLGSYTFRDEQNNKQKFFIVEDSTINFDFGEVPQSYLNHGENLFKFEISSPYGDFDTFENEFNVFYDKFPNQIRIDDFKNVTSESGIIISGSVTENTHSTYYLVNYNSDIVSTGVFIDNPVALDGNDFNITVTGLRDGMNSIRIVSVDPNNPSLLTADTKVNVLVDKTKPVISIVNSYFKTNVDSEKKVFLEGDDILTNYNSIVLNISVDGNSLNYTFNDKQEVAVVEGGSLELELNNLVSGQNNLDLIVTDLAGNIAHKAVQINYDDKPVALEDDTLKPENIFEQRDRKSVV